MNNERENYSWGIIQDMIEREINLAFKLREPIKMSSKKEIKQNEHTKTNHSRHQS